MDGRCVSTRTFTWVSLLVLSTHPLLSVAYEVVYAVNCGGGKHTDRFGIHYNADDNMVGVPSEFGRTLTISRVHPDDMILYQTERYHSSSFAYNIPVPHDGQYLLIAKFSEVYFQHPGGKVCLPLFAPKIAHTPLFYHILMVILEQGIEWQSYVAVQLAKWRSSTSARSFTFLTKITFPSSAIADFY